jgi:hypothetical protein
LLPIKVNTALRLSIACFAGLGAAGAAVCANVTAHNGPHRSNAQLALTARGADDVFNRMMFFSYQQ